MKFSAGFVLLMAGLWLLVDCVSRFLRDREFEAYRKGLERAFGRRR